MLEIDRYALVMTERLQEQVAALYVRYEFHPVVSALQSFCSEDLGAFYLDILKDRLYTTRADGRARRSAQTALWHITDALLKLMAPILSFTADEAWEVFAPETFEAEGGTIQSQVFHRFEPIADSAQLACALDADPRRACRRAQGDWKPCVNAATSVHPCRRK